MSKNRHTIRLKKYNYSQPGYYYVTICTQNRECLFGNIVGAIHESPVQRNNSPHMNMKLNDMGKIIEKIWKSLPGRFPIKLDVFQIMPNHVHMIIHIVGAIHESPLREKRSLLSQIIGYFKMNSSKLIHQINPNIPVWQRNYYEHIIRNENELLQIRGYIKHNPITWNDDINHE